MCMSVCVCVLFVSTPQNIFLYFTYTEENDRYVIKCVQPYYHVLEQAQSDVSDKH